MKISYPSLIIAVVLTLVLAFVPFHGFFSVGKECIPGNESCTHHYGWPVMIFFETDVANEGFFWPGILIDLIFWYVISLLAIKTFQLIKRH